MPGPFEHKDKVVHQVTDTDLNHSSPHHTLGSGPTQAARGNHTHVITAEEIEGLRDYILAIIAETP
jgi:hypothetical protein